ncbi:MAG: SIMPL domain-containing protein [Acidobacteria bacterium]|nr:SIMPL domain-containing protein [Acidobacteriota bacterium]
MHRFLIVTLLAAAAPAWVSAQRVPYVRASGEGTAAIKPDQMKLTVGVTTQADTAQQAAADNAARSTQVLDALRKLLGASADLQTIAYNVSPVYKYPSGSTPVLSGYSASNTIEATTGDLSIAGRLIDVAVQAGATTVGGIRFGLKDPQPARQIALKLAVQQARSSADAMAGGLGARLGGVISIAEASVASPVYTDRASTAVAAQTPIETGMVEVRAYVVIEALLEN